MEAQDKRPIILNEYKRDVHDMKLHAITDGNLEWLKLSMASLLSKPKGKGRISSFTSLVYPYSEEELIELLTYAFNIIWPGELITQLSEINDIDFVNMTEEEWHKVSGPNNTEIF